MVSAPGGSPRFFFSSRRRHTRYIGDWSSDVCSSDLLDFTEFTLGGTGIGTGATQLQINSGVRPQVLADGKTVRYYVAGVPTDESQVKIGRASCRERGTRSVAAGTLRSKAREPSDSRS